MMKKAEGVLDASVNSTLLEIAMELEQIALNDPYFVDRRLYPNVDFYRGVIFSAIGTPENMFTAIFAIGRMPGWIAQWAEMHRQPGPRSDARASSTPAPPRRGTSPSTNGRRGRTPPRRRGTGSGGVVRSPIGHRERRASPPSPTR